VRAIKLESFPESEEIVNVPIGDVLRFVEGTVLMDQVTLVMHNNLKLQCSGFPIPTRGKIVYHIPGVELVYKT
jgi:hypothetical protein